MLSLAFDDLTGRLLVGIGALSAGLGSIMSGIAALRKCKEKAENGWRW